MSHQRSLQVFKDSMLLGTDACGDLIASWCIKSETSQHHAYCIVCELNVKISDRGRSGLVSHALNKGHQKAAALLRNSNGALPQLKRTQPVLSSYCAKQVTTSASLLNDTKERSLKDKVTTAETLWSLIVAVKNLPFATSDIITDTIPSMFPDSKIAQNFKCQRNKTSRILSDGIGPHFLSLIENEVRNSAIVYTAVIDEATTDAHWRQFDVIIRYFSQALGRVVVQHLKSFTLGRANADHLKECIVDALSPLYLSKLLQISSDGPNVMKSLCSKVKEELNENLIDIGSCNIHKIHNAFSSALEEFGTLCETMVIDLFYLFKYSPAHREDYEAVQVKLGIKQHVFIRHVSSRWLTLQYSVDRISEQLPALIKYFLSFSNAQRNTDRIGRICTSLRDPLFEIELLFLKSVFPIFTRLTRFLQNEAPLIHLLHDELSTMILVLLQKFVQEKEIGSRVGSQLYKIDFKDTLKHLNKIEIGSKASSKLDLLLKQEKISQLDYKQLYHRALKFYIKATSELLRTLPLKNRLLNILKVLHPLSRKESWSKNAINQLATGFIGYFPRDLIDRVNEEWQVFKTENIPDTWYLTKEFQKQSELTDHDESASEDFSQEISVHYKPVDEFWNQVFQIKTASGSPKYPSLTKLMKISLTLSHGNADVERGFSENKRIITACRTNLNIETINGLRTSSSFMSRYKKQPNKVPITNALISSVQSSKKMYEERLEQRRKALKRKAEQQVETIKSQLENNGIRKSEKKARDMQSEGMAMLQSACEKQDLVKMEAANAILVCATKLFDDLAAITSKPKK